jgi:hypothetical protein
MNLVGKILTVLVFVMSLMFMALALSVYATHKNWKEVVENTTEAPGKPLGLAPRLEKAKKDNNDLKEQYKKLEEAVLAEKNAADQVRAKLESENSVLVKELAGLNQSKDQLEKDAREARADVKVSLDELGRLRGERDKLREDIRKAEKDRDDHFNQVVRLTDERNHLDNELKRLKDTNVTLAADFAKAKQVLDKFGLKGDPQAHAGMAPAGIKGSVTAALGDGTVELNIGSDDGIMPKQKLEIVSPTGNTYVGRVEVISTAPNKSVCKGIRETLQRAIQVNDRVTSKL